ncbi:metalloprotease [Haloarchaeobius litoreus]|uniref:Metalloprotease n=1 Tax=Haloarchaeobius litoreus TaxID=755306 RepID=A0ABD6DHE3_9EURY|nr:metalloprotease [Haloarchaeobius litoreus]
MSTTMRSIKETEIRDLLAAWVAISVAFAILAVRSGFGYRQIANLPLSEAVVLCAVTAGVAFLLHELAHKFTAQHFGYPAAFKADYNMLLLAIFSAMVGFLFAAPGAVYHPRTGERESGLIALAGPATNVALLAVFYPLFFFGGFVESIGILGVWINAFLAGFNMIPYGPLDGKKVWNWSKPVFVVSFAVCGSLAAGAFLGYLP